MTMGISGDARERLSNLAQTTPEWEAWLRLLGVTLEAIQDPVWDKCVPDVDAGDGARGAPLLEGATLEVDPRHVHRWVTRLLTMATEAGGMDGSALSRITSSDATESVYLIEAAVQQDSARLTELALKAGSQPGALAATASLAAMPLLQACGRRLTGQAPRTWSHGYCPICGAWPAMAELRGLERERRMRCSGCGGDWSLPSLQCPYCNNKDFRKLGSLLPEENFEARKADTCEVCKGYVKTISTLMAQPPDSVALEDLATVDLDVAALERGYSRPPQTGWSLSVHVAAAPTGKRGLSRWWS